MQDNKFKFGEMISRLNRAKVDLPKKIATEVQFYFATNYRKKSWDGVPWQPRSPRSKSSKPLGVYTGALRASMSNVIISANWKTIIWGVKGITYAGYFNFGTDKMPAREILGDGKQVRGKIKGIIKTEFDKIMLIK
jgi:phage gpG-like protein